ncbi:transmembrane protein 14C-like [Mizuhopecten yessoensis]|uniref:Transmembrane protein 14C n=1 Tax=Mizuhopecten yessoensis TaxID=6573 RepID=A0A210QBD4_MIZYE|nr:transmembrane protein 14C-like [Mizuhopecten yessoensis]OWF46044.1 Transmembrane protein 14C [Mizuhopecten yessoensis]
MPIDYVSIAYAVTVAAGGVLGYTRAGSIPSLAAGIICGGLMGVGAYQTTQNPKNVMLSLVVSGLLLTVMGSRFYKTHKVMPAGIVAGLSVLMVVRFGYRLTQK